MIIMIN